MVGAGYVSALPDGQAVIMTSNTKVLRVDNHGEVVRELYNGSSSISGLIVQGSHLFVLHYNGSVVQMEPQDGHILNIYDSGISDLLNWASHPSDLCNIDPSILLLIDDTSGQINSYNISSQTRTTNVELSAPRSANHGCIDGNVVYIVSNFGHAKVHVYNSSWSLITSFGGWGNDDGQFRYLYSAVMSDQGYIFAADGGNSRLSMFTSDGQFIKHVVIYEDTDPRSLSVRDKYLWVVTRSRRLIRYMLY